MPSHTRGSLSLQGEGTHTAVELQVSSHTGEGQGGIRGSPLRHTGRPSQGGVDTKDPGSTSNLQGGPTLVPAVEGQGQRKGRAADLGL